MARAKDGSDDNEHTYKTKDVYVQNYLFDAGSFIRQFIECTVTAHDD